MGRVIQSAFHKHLIESINDVLEVCRKIRETTDKEEKEILGRKFNALSSAVGVCMSKYDVKKLKFTIVDYKGKRKNAR